MKCLECQGKTTYTGKTNVIRLRTNNGCKHGNSTNIFDSHVFSCKQGKNMKEPYFELYAFMTIKKESDLLAYKAFLHKKGYDTMNRME